MKLKNIFNKIAVVIISLVFLTLSVTPSNALAGPNKHSKRWYKRPPPGSHRVTHGNIHYVVHKGRFYKPGRGGYIYTRPSRGVVVVGLPLAATFLVVAGLTYYIFDNIYYRKVPAGYQVVETPQTATARTKPTAIENSVRPGAQAVVVAKSLNVRTGPGLNYEVQSRVYSGDLLIVKTSAVKWVYVRLPNNSYGWVMTRFISITDTGAKG